MKHINLLLFITLAGFIAILTAGSDSGENVQPATPLFSHGKNVGSVEFDCTIELVAPVTKERHIFFMRYQVSPKEIAYDIHWAEPAWQHVDFPYPPFGLSMYADESQFILYSAWNDRRWEHTRPETRPETFNFTLGNYPIDEQRHFYSESLLGRMYVDDIKTIVAGDRGTDARGFTVVGSPVANSEARRGLRTVNFGIVDDCLFFEKSLSKNPKAYGELAYRFKGNRLERLSGHLRERVIPVGGFEIESKTDEFPEGITITQLPAKYHEGDRRFEALFADVEIGTQNVTLPQQISVWSSRKTLHNEARSFIRGATLSNFRPVEKMMTPANIGTFFSDTPYFDEEQKFRKLSIEYWLKKPEDIPEEQIQWFSDFAEKCLERYAVAESLPDRLRLIHMVIISDLHVGNLERIEKQLFSTHLSELTDNGFPEIASGSLLQFLDLCRQWDVSIQLPDCPESVHDSENSESDGQPE